MQNVKEWHYYFSYSSHKLYIFVKQKRLDNNTFIYYFFFFAFHSVENEDTLYRVTTTEEYSSYVSDT